MPDEAEMEILINDLTGGFGNDIMLWEGGMPNDGVSMVEPCRNTEHHCSDIYAHSEGNAEEA